MARTFTLATTPFTLSISGGPQETFNGTVYGQGAAYSFAQQLANGTGAGNAQLGVLNGQLQLTAVVTAGTAPTVTPSNSGGSIAAGTYTLAYSYYNASGETTISANGTPGTTTGASGSIVVTAPALPAGATGINIYLTAGGTPGKVGTVASNTTTLTTMSPTGSLPGANNTATIAGSIDLTSVISAGRNFDFSGTDDGNGAGGGGGIKILVLENTDATVGQTISFLQPANNWTNGLGTGVPRKMGAAPALRAFFEANGIAVASNNKIIQLQALYNTPVVNYCILSEGSWI